MISMKCNICGGDIELSPNGEYGICVYCGAKQVLSQMDTEKKRNLYERADYLKKQNDFDKAITAYEAILNEDATETEAYWSLVLCKYGVEYVEDPATHELVPTCHRTQFSSILSDSDYKKALEYATPLQQREFETEAQKIEQIQKNILAISNQIEPFDVFICYKESDDYGNRTEDSVLAQDLYYQLTNEGFKVFFARITLEDKLGQAYEPYIFAALNSAKIMIVLGTKPEYFNATWVKNEWSRYLQLIKNGENKMIIPAYRNMDPYDIPEEFSHLQAQDMSKLGFVQDLVRGITKVCKKKEETNSNTNSYSSTKNQEDSLIKRAYMFIEDEAFQKANEILENALNINPENANAYIAKLLVHHKVKSMDELLSTEISFFDSPYFKRAKQFADGELSNYLERLPELCENAKKEKKYQKLCEEKKLGRLNKFDVIRAFEELGQYKDSESLIEEIKNEIYLAACQRVRKAKNIDEIKRLKNTFIALNGYNDSQEIIGSLQKMEVKKQKQLEKRFLFFIGIIVILAIIIAILIFIGIAISNAHKENKYQNAQDLERDDKLYEAYLLYSELDDYDNSRKKAKKLNEKLEEQYTVAIELYDENASADERLASYEQFVQLGDYADSKKYAEEIEEDFEDEYEKAVELFEDEQYREALEIFEELSSYKQSEDYVSQCTDCSIIGHLYIKEKCSDNSTCENCGKVKKDATQCVSDKEPTCTEPKICNECSAVMEPALGHIPYEVEILGEIRCKTCYEVIK